MMKKLVLVLLLAACAAFPLFFAAPAQAQWVKSGPVTFDPTQDQNVTTGGSNTVSAPAMDVKSTASVTSSGPPASASAKCQRTYTQNFNWSGPGGSTWNTWGSDLSGGADGNFIGQGSFVGGASSDTGAGVYYYGGGGRGSCTGPSNTYNSPLSTSTATTTQTFGNQSGKVTASISYTLSASANGNDMSGGAGQFTATGHASVSMGNPYQ